MSIYLPTQLSQILKIYRKKYQLSSSDRNDGTKGDFYYLMLILNTFNLSNDDMCCCFLYDYYLLYEGENLFVRVYITSHDRAYLSPLLYESQDITPPFIGDMISHCAVILDTKYMGNKNKPWEDARKLIEQALFTWD